MVWSHILSWSNSLIILISKSVTKGLTIIQCLKYFYSNFIFNWINQINVYVLRTMVSNSLNAYENFTIILFLWILKIKYMFVILISKTYFVVISFGHRNQAANRNSIYMHRRVTIFICNFYSYDWINQLSHLRELYGLVQNMLFDPIHLLIHETDPKRAPEQAQLRPNALQAPFANSAHV